MPRLFDSANEDIIYKFMLENPNHQSPFAELSRKIPFTNKQISHHWNNVLNPLLDHDTFSDHEKSFISNWVRGNRMANGTIHWKNCQRDMKIIFNKLYPANKIKNAWNSEQKRLARDVEYEMGPSAQITVPYPTSINSTINESGSFTRITVSSLLSVSGGIIPQSPIVPIVPIVPIMPIVHIGPTDSIGSIGPIGLIGPMEPYFRPDLTEFDRNCLLNITYGYRKYF